MFPSACSAHEQTLVCPTFMQNSLNMHLRLITLETNPSGRAVTGARCSRRTAAAVNANTMCSSFLGRDPKIRLLFWIINLKNLWEN